MKQAYRRQDRWANGEANRPGAGFAAVVANPKLKLMDQVREVMRLRHYSIRKWNLYEPTKAPKVPMRINAGAASRLRTLHQGRKGHLRHTEHPNALPAPWHCPGSPGARFCESVSAQRARFAFGQGCDCAAMSAPFIGE